MQPLLFPSGVPEERSVARPQAVIPEVREVTDGIDRLFYSRQETPFGTLLVYSTDRGICELHFIDAVPEADLQAEIQVRYPQAALIASAEACHHIAAVFISGTGTVLPVLHLFGTPFQLRVWEALLYLPSGRTISYGELAMRLQLPKTASRAVGTAVAQNPVAVLIPCHRVVSSSGQLTGFRWGLDRKRALLQAEFKTF